MKTFLQEEKSALEASRARFVAKRLDAIKRRNEYQITLFGDLIGSLDDMLFNINFTLGIKPKKTFTRMARMNANSNPRKE